MSNSDGFSKFGLNVRGEHLRGALALRLKELDRHIERGELAIGSCASVTRSISRAVIHVVPP